MNRILYNLDGTITEEPKGEFYFLQINHDISFPGDDIFYDIDSKLVSFYDYFTSKIFPDNDYYDNIYSRPIWLSTYGIDADFSANKVVFEELIKNNCTPINNKLLLLSDINSIISSIQNRILETKIIFIKFYIELAKLNPNFPITEPNGVYWMSGQDAFGVYSYLENLLIKLYAIFDLLTKLCVEADAEYSDFTTWPTLYSKNVLYGEKKKLGTRDWTGTVFDHRENVRLLINLRNDIIHNGSFEYQNKIYFEYKDFKVDNKFIFLIDNHEGCIDCVRNRKRFFSQGRKINMELPDFYMNLIRTIYSTLIVLFQDKKHLTISST